MNLEDRLDALLSASGQPALPLPDDEQTRPLIPLLNAARRLGTLRDVQPDARFADELARTMLSQAATLRAQESVATAGHVPTEPLSLVRGSLDAAGDAATEIGEPVPLWPGISRGGGATGSFRQQRRSKRLPLWAHLVAAACLLLALGVTSFAVGANAQPGSPFFALHRAEEWAQVTLAAPADRARLHLRYASEALATLDSAVAQHNSAAYGDALDAFQSEMSAAAVAIAALPSGDTHDALTSQLTTLQQQGRADLHTALSAFDWTSRVTTTAALATLGDSVPQVTGAALHEIAAQSPQTTHSGHEVQVVVSGSGFEAGALLVINGQPTGTVLSVTGDTLIAQVTLDPGTEHVIAVGVENPDGTAAETQVISHDAAVTATPAPTATPTRHGGHGGHGGHG
jgi:hypothetical protein